MNTTTSTAASATASVSAASTQPASFKLIGVLLAVGSGLFIGASFVFKKKVSRTHVAGRLVLYGARLWEEKSFEGLLSAQAKSGGVAGDGHSYLKSPMWWTGMTLMIVGEILNFVAYAFTEAILVTPLGALSVVVCAVLSSIFLKERLTFFGKIGAVLCILGATIIALNGPQEQTTSTIPEFQKLFLAPGFLVFGSIVILTSLGLIFFVAPKYGKTHMLVYISICSLIGGLSVACTQGLGSSILTSIRGDNQFKHWFIYFLLGFVIITLLTEINYLNKALELFNTSMVTPTYYVLFTGSTLITSVILYQGFKASAVDIVTVVMGFLTIVCGITLLQLSKVDPVEIKGKLDRRSTLLLSAARSEVHRDGDQEKGLDIEDPGMDSLRGFAGAIGSIHRAVSARRSMRREGRFDPSDILRRRNLGNGDQESGDHGMIRYQLSDGPMHEAIPHDASDKISLHSNLASPNPQYAENNLTPNRIRSPTITFANHDDVHLYGSKGDSGIFHHQQELRKNDHMHGPRDPPPRSADIASNSFPPQLPPLPATSPYHDPYYSGNRDEEVPEAEANRSRFNLPGFPRGASRDGGNRVNHPRGPPDVDATESMRLVNRDSDDEDEYRGGSHLQEMESRESSRL